MPMRKRVPYKIVVSDLEECADRSGLIAMTCRPGADGTERGQDRSVGLEKKIRAALRRPCGEIIGTGCDLIFNLFDTEDLPRGVVRD